MFYDNWTLIRNFNTKIFFKVEQICEPTLNAY